MSLFEDKITIKDDKGNEQVVKALCETGRSAPNLDGDAGNMIKVVKVVFIDGHEVNVGVDGSFYHPDTRVLYSV